MPPLTERKAPHRSQKHPPIKTVHKLVDKLIEVAQKYGDQPPVVVVRTPYGFERYEVTRVEICGAQDHTLILVEPEQ